MKNKITIQTILVLICIIPVGLFIVYEKKENNITIPKITHVVIRAVSVPVEIADTAKERQNGLSGREALNPNTGMLFIFEKSDLHGFWMPNMRFSIDIIWIDEALTVVDFEEKVSPESYPTIFLPDRPARYVLEVPAGFVAHRSIHVGDQVTVKNLSQDDNS